jgi:adenosylcobinamide-phosphate synthase
VSAPRTGGAAVLVAMLLDHALGEPPLRAHPVAWAGRHLDRVAPHVPASPPSRAVAVGAGHLAERAVRRWPAPLREGARGAALWPLLSARLLLAEVAAVEAALASGNLSPADGRAGGVEAGRRALARIVGRETCDLSATEVRSGAVESLAENLSDSVVAPLCWFVVAGLPGAAAHRFVNTADAMWGHRTPRWLHAGRVAARADDLANLVPARLTALLVLPHPRRWRRLRAEAASTSSPNAGWPMAAAALRLDLRLGKRGHHLLHPHGARPGPGDVDRALALVHRTVLAATLLATAAAAVRPPAPTTGGDR